MHVTAHGVIGPLASASPGTTSLLSVQNIRKHFTRRDAIVRAVNDVSFVLAAGEVLALVGESGSGKSTLGRLVIRLIEPSQGRIVLDGVDITTLPVSALRRLRRAMQMVFQDAYSSLNPRMTVGATLTEALLLHGICTRSQAHEQATHWLTRVGLKPEHFSRYPRTFSGGQHQRIAIARALAVQPRLLVADEPVSALDVSMQAEIINLLQDLQDGLGLAMLFISHDLSVVETISDRVMVLYLGRTMEIAPTATLYRRPAHPYTAALLQAAPGGRYGARRILLRGEIPSPAAPPSGCVFRTRCPFALDACAQSVPSLRPVGPQHYKACIRDDLHL